MDVLGDLVSRDRRSDAPALRAVAPGRTYDYRRFCTSAWKVGNYLRHLGVRTGAVVAVADDPVPEAVLSAYGAALLGGVVRFGPPREVDARALVCPTGQVDDHALPPGGQRVAYGARHEDPSVGYFERDVWSENPTEPPDRVAPTDPLLSTGERTLTHDQTLTAAREVVDEWGLDAGEAVAVRAPFSHPGTVVAGLVAPILAGATVLLPDERDPGADGEYAVGDAGPERVRIAPDDVPLPGEG